MSAPVRVTVNITHEALDALRSIADRRGTTMTEALRSAIGTERFFAQQRAAGSKILLRRADGSFHEILFDR